MHRHWADGGAGLRVDNPRPGIHGQASAVRVSSPSHTCEDAVSAASVVGKRKRCIGNIKRSRGAKPVIERHCAAKRVSILDAAGGNLFLSAGHKPSHSN